MKIKTEGFSKEEEEKFNKLEGNTADFERLLALEEKLQKEENSFASPNRDAIIEGLTTPKTMLDKYGVSNEIAGKAYPSVSRYFSKIRERFMKNMSEAGREGKIDSYLDRYSKNVKDR